MLVIPFLAITAHSFLNCNALSGLLTFASFKGSHTEVHIAEEIYKAITDNHLENKVSFIITDNASNMKRACDILKERQGEVVDELTDEDDEDNLNDETLWKDIEDSEVDIQQIIDLHCTLRLSCFAHMLQLVIKDRLSKLNTTAVHSLTAKCSKLCNFVH